VAVRQNAPEGPDSSPVRGGLPGTVIATFSAAVTLSGDQVFIGRQPFSVLEWAVFSCDYNGWADVPEEEREGIEAFEASHPPLPLPLPLQPGRPTARRPPLPTVWLPQQRAA
jgi:hypothetical protein